MSFQKALRSLETGVSGLDAPDDADQWSDQDLEAELRQPGAHRLWYAAEALSERLVGGAPARGLVY